jgi:hypothetical protein
LPAPPLGDAIWFKASVDRIADILARQGDTDPVEIRRSKAIGILAQPAEALQLLYKHQDDDWDGPAEPSDLDEPTEDGSLQLVPPPIDPDRARPRAVVYVHLSAEALTASIGVARVEEVGPVLLGRLRAVVGDRCSISLKPVIDLLAGHTPVDSYEIPASLREQLLLRNPADVFPYAAAVSRSVDVDHTIPYLSPDRGGPPGQTRIGNLGPQVRRHHRLKTHGGWQVRQPNPALGCGDHPSTASIWSTHGHPPPRRRRVRRCNLACRRGPAAAVGRLTRPVAFL